MHQSIEPLSHGILRDVISKLMSFAFLSELALLCSNLPDLVGCIGNIVVHEFNSTRCIFVLVAVAELGDKTQFAVIALSAE